MDAESGVGAIVAVESDIKIRVEDRVKIGRVGHSSHEELL